ncbi:MAG: SDR family oxidoreductase [Coxiellaceae bacterium]|nr:SDR family oxidoreductase [Coxiellaceae bacterium]
MVTSQFDLTQKHVLITGGAGLLGREHARALLECGSKVTLADINNAALDRAISELAEYADKVSSVVMDVTSKDSIQSAASSINPVDILVNNAAIDPKVSKNIDILQGSRLENLSLQQWDFQLGVGLTGAFLCSQHFGSCMAKRNQGVILNIASDLSVIAPDQRLYKDQTLQDDEQPVKPVTYSVIKTALIGLTRYLATYWADKNVRVNALSPGGVHVDQPQDFVTKVSSMIPLGRMASKNEYHSAIQFLCSDASSYMTGHNMVIDGGRSIW